MARHGDSPPSNENAQKIAGPSPPLCTYCTQLQLPVETYRRMQSSRRCDNRLPCQSRQTEIAGEFANTFFSRDLSPAGLPIRAILSAFPPFSTRIIAYLSYAPFVNQTISLAMDISTFYGAVISTCIRECLKKQGFAHVRSLYCHTYHT